MLCIALKGASLFTVAVALTACGSTKQQPSQPAPAMSQSTSASPQAAASASTATRVGTFRGLNDKHVAGIATINGDQVVLSGFSSDEGPDLHLYLTSGSDENAVAEGKELGPVAFDKASQTFSASGVDPSKYTTIVIHCDKAKAVFGSATLT
jgi:hypothetical protein